MAHRGRRYPVHFRRDYNQGGNIAAPWVLAENYHVPLFSIYPFPPAPVGTDFVCPGQPVSGVSDPTWLSDPVANSGHLWQLRITVYFSALPDSILRSRLELSRLDVGLVLQWRNGEGSYSNPFDNGITGGVEEYRNAAV